MRHPQVGELFVWCEKLAIGGTPGPTLVLYHTQPGTPDTEKLTLLATLADQPGSAAAAPPLGVPPERLAASGSVELQ